MSLSLAVLTSMLAALASDPGAGTEAKGSRYAMQVRTSLLSGNWSWFLDLDLETQQVVFDKTLRWMATRPEEDAHRLLKAFFDDVHDRLSGPQAPAVLRQVGRSFAVWVVEATDIEELARRLNLWDDTFYQQELVGANFTTSDFFMKRGSAWKIEDRPKSIPTWGEANQARRVLGFDLWSWDTRSNDETARFLLYYTDDSPSFVLFTRGQLRDEGDWV